MGLKSSRPVLFPRLHAAWNFTKLLASFTDSYLSCKTNYASSILSPLSFLDVSLRCLSGLLEGPLTWPGFDRLDILFYDHIYKFHFGKKAHQVRLAMKWMNIRKAWDIIVTPRESRMIRRRRPSCNI